MTFWHALFAAMLRRALHGACTVRTEVELGTLPLRLDFLLSRLPGTQLPPEATTELTPLAQRLRQHTIVQLTSPADMLADGDLFQALGYVFHCLRQELPGVPLTEAGLMLVAPALTRPFQNEVTRHGWALTEEERGVHRVVGAPLACWLVEADVLADTAHPVLALFSRAFRQQFPRLVGELLEAGHDVLVNYMLQQIAWVVREGRGDLMPFKVKSEMERSLEEVLSEFPARLRLAGMTPKERIEGLTPEERLEGLAPEQLLSGLPPERRAEILRLLQQEDPSRPPQGGPKP